MCRRTIQNSFEQLEMLGTATDKQNPLFSSLKNYFSMNFNRRFDFFVRSYLLFYSHGAYGPFLLTNVTESSVQNLLLPGIDLLNHETYSRPQGPIQILNEVDGTINRYYARFNVKEVKHPGEEVYNSYDPIEVYEMKNAEGNQHKHCNNITYANS